MGAIGIRFLQKAAKERPGVLFVRSVLYCGQRRIQMLSWPQEAHKAQEQPPLGLSSLLLLSQLHPEIRQKTLVIFCALCGQKEIRNTLFATKEHKELKDLVVFRGT